MNIDDSHEDPFSADDEPAASESEPTAPVSPEAGVGEPASPSPATSASGSTATPSSGASAEMERRAEEFRDRFKRLRAGIQQAMIGQREVIDATLIALVSKGHVLLEGVPGLGKTHLVRTLSEVLHVEFNRVQFTPDLMPADIVGTNLVVDSPDGGKAFEFQPGPIFTNICLADEINRATPKTQSALLEAMQERSVTTAGKIRKLPSPFFVLATQNPLEMEGTYPLPEAQLDRFFFKINVDYPTHDELMRIVDLTTGTKPPSAERVLTGDEFLAMQHLVGEVPVAPHVQSYAMRLVLATQPASEHSPEMVKRYVNYGSSPRGAQAIVLAGKARALLDGRLNVSFEDIEWAAPNAVRHRLILNFEGEAEGMTADQVVQEILRSVDRDKALKAAL